MRFGRRGREEGEEGPQKEVVKEEGGTGRRGEGKGPQKVIDRETETGKTLELAKDPVEE